MFKIIIVGLLTLFTTIASIFTTPVNALLTDVFPQASEMLGVVNSVISNYIIGGIGWVVDLLPPITFGAIGFFITGVVVLRNINLGIDNINRGLNFIKRINIFSSR